MVKLFQFEMILQGLDGKGGVGKWEVKELYPYFGFWRQDRGGRQSKTWFKKEKGKSLRELK